MIDKIVDINTDNSENDFKELQVRKNELEDRIIKEEEHKAFLVEEINKLDLRLLNTKSRYNSEQTLKNKNKHKLYKITKSRSWRLSLPIRKIGELLKKTKLKRNNTPYVNDIREVLMYDKQQGNAKDLEIKLWGGYSLYALEELKKLKTSSAVPINERMRATRSIARWYYDQGQFHKAYEELEYVNEVKPINKPNQDRVITEIKVLKKLGDLNLARRKIWDVIDARGLQSELCLSMAHIADKEIERLNWYNILYDKHGYQQINKMNDSNPLELENIYSTRTKVDKELGKYKVSIIIPAYNAAGLIHIALNSLLNQTIQNLEIIVVNDCSSDNTEEVVQKYATKDDRIKLITKNKNEGAYAARNTGIQYASGDFVTIHDSDDWSHSEKIEVQLRELVMNPESVGSVSYLIRASNDTCPINGGSLLSMKFLMMNSSSLLVRKSVFTKIGGWDSVRVAGDSEFIWRIEKVFGERSIIRVEPNVPLSISLYNESSLTGTSTTHVKTIRFGLRRTYREAFEWWHDKAKSVEELFMDPIKINRHFPCPVPNLVLKPNSRNYDFVLIADFSTESDQDTLKNILEHLAKRDRKLALFHWPDYEGDPTNTVTPDIYHLVNQKSIDILVPNEEIQAGKTIFLTPKILDYTLDSVPNIYCNQVYIVSDDETSSENKLRKEKNLEQTMHHRAEWCTMESLKNN